MPPAQDSPAPHDLPVPDGALTDRFLESLLRLWPEGKQTPELRLGLAVSGGPDSCAMLLLAAAALPGRIEAATVDHQLRPENADEAEAVAALCCRLDVPHRTLAVTVADGNIQANARAARYGGLGEWMQAEGLAALATAHHADDQAETLLMRLNRASGVAGLAGARERGRLPGTALPLLRPLLGWRRAELAAIVNDARIDVANDSSNEDERFDRVRIRKALADADWLDVPAIARSAMYLADADTALNWAARREWEENVGKAGPGLIYRPHAPRAVALLVIDRIVRELEGEAPRGGAVAQLFDTLLSGAPASIGNLVARPGPSGWSFSQAPRRRSRSSGVESRK